VSKHAMAPVSIPTSIGRSIPWAPAQKSDCSSQRLSNKAGLSYLMKRGRHIKSIRRLISCYVCIGMEREEGDGEKRHVRSGLQKRTLVG
jgi:hypothetical protein